MPYVEGFGTWPFGEEWLWEAVSCVYLPLIDLLGELEAPVTLGVTPVLCDQLETLPGEAGDRLLGFLRGHPPRRARGGLGGARPHRRAGAGGRGAPRRRRLRGAP